MVARPIEWRCGRSCPPHHIRAGRRVEWGRPGPATGGGGPSRGPPHPGHGDRRPLRGRGRPGQQSELRAIVAVSSLTAAPTVADVTNRALATTLLTLPNPP